jgi:hypothetical protein
MYTRSVTEFAVPLLFKLINHSVSRQQPNQKKKRQRKKPRKSLYLLLETLDQGLETLYVDWWLLTLPNERPLRLLFRFCKADLFNYENI